MMISKKTNNKHKQQHTTTITHPSPPFDILYALFTSREKSFCHSTDIHPLPPSTTSTPPPLV